MGNLNKDSGTNESENTAPRGGSASGSNVAVMGNENSQSARMFVRNSGSHGAAHVINLTRLGDRNSVTGVTLVDNSGAFGSASAINLALVGNKNQFAGDAEATNTGAFGRARAINAGDLINIAILPQGGTGNCTTGVCVNVPGLQLLGG